MLVLPPEMQKMKVKSQFGSGETPIESYLIDGIEYVHGADGWQNTTVNGVGLPQQSANIADGLKPRTSRCYPTGKRTGVEVSVFAVETPPR
jgi:hypothetical protein